MKRFLAFWLLTLATLSAQAEQFSFIALGDTAYQGEPSVQAYYELISLINEQDIEFSIHVGDIWGASMCVESRYEEIRDTFNTFTKPVVFTPGDNEWTDCDRHAYGDWNNADRLDVLRNVFFDTDSSMGETKLKVVRQADVSRYTNFVENARWLTQNVLFFTLNVPGSNNNVHVGNKQKLIEAHERNEANVAWLRDTFRIAGEQEYAAVVVAMQAEMFANTGGQRVPQAYADLVNELRIASRRFVKPVLLIHGDAHRFTIDRPLATFGQGRLNDGNLVRLQVYGDPEVRAVRVTVDTQKAWIFGYEPLYIQ